MSLIRSGAFVVIATALTATLAAQSSRGRFDLEVRGDFFAGLTGDAARLQKAMGACERTLAADPKNGEALVWHGSGLYFQAGQAFRSGDADTGAALAAKGRKEMDEAVAMEPDNVGVRIPRGATLLEAARQMPPDAARPLLTTAIGDYEHVLEMQRATFAKLSDHARGELLFGLADGWARLGDLDKARMYFERLTQDATESPRAAEARERLSAGVARRGPVARCSGCHA